MLNGWAAQWRSLWCSVDQATGYVRWSLWGYLLGTRCMQSSILKSFRPVAGVGNPQCGWICRCLVENTTIPFPKKKSGVLK